MNRISTYELVEADVELAALVRELVQVRVAWTIHCACPLRLFLLVCFLICIDRLHLLVIATFVLYSHLLSTGSFFALRPVSIFFVVHLVGPQLSNPG